MDDVFAFVEKKLVAAVLCGADDTVDCFVVEEKKVEVGAVLSPETPFPKKDVCCEPVVGFWELKLLVDGAVIVLAEKNVEEESVLAENKLLDPLVLLGPKNKFDELVV